MEVKDDFDVSLLEILLNITQETYSELLNDSTSLIDPEKFDFFINHFILALWARLSKTRLLFDFVSDLGNLRDLVRSKFSKIFLYLDLPQNYLKIRPLLNLLKEKSKDSSIIDMLFTKSFPDRDSFINSVFQNDSIRSILRNDDFPAFQLLSSEPGFDFNNFPNENDDIFFEIEKYSPTLIQFAALYGSISCFKFLLLNQPDLHKLDSQGLTLTHYAIAGGNFEIIHILEQNSFDFNGMLEVAAEYHQNEIFNWLYETKDTNLKPAFISACSSNNLKIAKFCLEKGIDPNLGWIHAVRNSSLDIIKLLLNNEKLKPQAGFPIQKAAAANALDSIKLLLSDSRFSVNDVGVCKNRAIHEAASKVNPELLEFVLRQSGIDVNAQNNYGISALHKSIGNTNIEILKLLVNVEGIDLNVQDLDGIAPIHDAARQDDNGCEKLRFLLQYQEKINVNIESESGDTPLLIAVSSKSTKAVSVLLDFMNIDPNVKQPLSIAVSQNDMETIDKLINDERVELNYIEFSSDEVLSKFVEIQRFDANSQIHFAIKRDFIESAKIIINRSDFDVNARDAENKTPLHIAVAEHRTEIVELLIKKPNIDINAIDCDKRTALHYSAFLTQTDMMEILLSFKGISINVQDKDQKTPLFIASELGNEFLVKMLLSFPGINRKLTNDTGYTALQMAGRKGHLNVVNIYMEDKKRRKAEKSSCNVC